MVNKLFISIICFFICSVAYSQAFYKNEIKSKDGIEIKYKINHTKMFDKNSPVKLSLKLKNTNNYDVNLGFEIEYSTGFTTRYKSGNVDICIPGRMTRKGKANGLAFELNTNDKDIFSSDDTEWEFTKFDIKQTEKCDR